MDQDPVDQNSVEPSVSGSESTDHRLILASRVLSTSVYNEGGDRIGHIDDLSIERATGRVEYAILSFGGFLGIGEQFHPLPWSALHYDLAKGGFIVHLDKAALEGAPNYTRSELAALGGDRHHVQSTEIFEYYARYGVGPF